MYVSFCTCICMANYAQVFDLCTYTGRRSTLSFKQETQWKVNGGGGFSSIIGLKIVYLIETSQKHEMYLS